MAPASRSRRTIASSGSTSAVLVARGRRARVRRWWLWRWWIWRWCRGCRRGRWCCHGRWGIVLCGQREAKRPPEGRWDALQQPAKILHDRRVGLGDAGQAPVTMGRLAGEDQQVVAELETATTVRRRQQLLQPSVQEGDDQRAIAALDLEAAVERFRLQLFVAPGEPDPAEDRFRLDRHRPVGVHRELAHHHEIRSPLVPPRGTPVGAAGLATLVEPHVAGDLTRHRLPVDLEIEGPTGRRLDPVAPVTSWGGSEAADELLGGEPTGPGL